MATLKKFWKYFLLFIGFFILTAILTKVAMRDEYVNIKNYEIKVKSPKIEVIECKAKNSVGYVRGEITNDTEELIPLKYLRINVFDKDEVYLGSEYKELKSFAPKETIKFDIQFKYMNVKKITLDVVDNIPSKIGFIDNIEDENLKIALPIAGLLTFHTILP